MYVAFLILEYIYIYIFDKTLILKIFAFNLAVETNKLWVKEEGFVLILYIYIYLILVLI